MTTFASCDILPLIHSTSPHQKAEFHEFAKIPPADLLKLEADVYRTIVGVVELVCVGCLLCPHSRVQLLGNYVLLVVMLGALYTHFAMKHTADHFVPALVAFALLATRLYTCGRLEVKLKTR